jgi:hypothetical protein
MGQLQTVLRHWIYTDTDNINRRDD